VSSNLVYSSYNRGRFLPYAVGQWFFSLRDSFLAGSECTFEIANMYIVCTRWVHDRIIMEDALIGDYIVSEIQAINRCRSYLQVEYLSDFHRRPPTDSDLAQPPSVIIGMIKWLSRAFWAIPEMAPVPHSAHAFHEQPATPNPRLTYAQPRSRTRADS
jgi:hypothetical protein